MMAFLYDVFGRVGRVAREQANAGVDVLEDATLEATVRQTAADMKTEMNKVGIVSASASSNYNTLDAEYQKYVRQTEEWKGRANIALDAGNEDLARKPLAKKAECDQQVTSMKSTVERTQATSEKLQQVTPSNRRDSRRAPVEFPTRVIAPTDECRRMSRRRWSEDRTWGTTAIYRAKGLSLDCSKSSCGHFRFETNRQGARQTGGRQWQKA